MTTRKTVDRMPWGKYKGTPLRKVPLKYLMWLMNSMAFPPECVSDELYRRFTANPPKSSRLVRRAKAQRRRGHKPTESPAPVGTVREHDNRMHAKQETNGGDVNARPFNPVPKEGMSPTVDGVMARTSTRQGP
jgi:hypothetical protein